jgi:hypothetical protein
VKTIEARPAQLVTRKRKLVPAAECPTWAARGKTGQRGDHRLCSGPGLSACEPYREAIDLGLSRGRNARAIWQDLVSEYGFASSYQSVQRFVRDAQSSCFPARYGGYEIEIANNLQVFRHNLRKTANTTRSCHPVGAAARNKSGDLSLDLSLWFPNPHSAGSAQMNVLADCPSARQYG